MIEHAPRSRGRDALRATWAAVAWLQGTLLLGLFFIAIAAARDLEWCVGSLGCEDESTDPGSVVLALIGLGLMLAGPVLAARSSGWPVWLGVAVVAVVAFLGSLALGVAVFAVLLGNGLPGLVLALAVFGGIAVRPPCRRAVTARVVLLGSLVVLTAAAVAIGSFALFATFALVTVPAVGLADTIALLQENRARGAPIY